MHSPVAILHWSAYGYNLESTFEGAMAAKAATLAVLTDTVAWPEEADLRDGALLERLQVLARDYRPRRKLSSEVVHV